MSTISILSRTQDGPEIRMSVAALDEDGSELSHGTFVYTDTAFANTTVRTMLAGGVGTPVEHRRCGHVRRIFDDMHRQAISDGVAIALLHPFSFAYYNQFGYERVADHKMAFFPTRLLDFVPRECDFVPYASEHLPDMLAIYARFSKGRYLLFPRFDDRHYTHDRAYICYGGDTPIAYIVIATGKEYHVNNYSRTWLVVKELAYVSPLGLQKALSFLRMFEGEFEEIELYDVAAYPELELRLRHYEKTRFTCMPDLQAKLLNTERLLTANTYPEKAGEFTVRVVDELPTVGGVFRVCYGGGVHTVHRLPEDAAADITLPAPVLVRLIYANDPITADTVQYLPSVTVHGNVEDLFRAFPHRPIGVFEHF